MPLIDYYRAFLAKVFDGGLENSFSKDLDFTLLRSRRTFASRYNVQDKKLSLSQILERRRSLPGRHDGLPNRLKKEIRESFPILDTDSDGLVSRSQVEDLVYRIDPDMTHEEMQDLLDTADLDADGMYDMDEYLFLMYLKWNDQESVDDIKEAFRVFDKDSSGTLSRDEFAFILRKLGEPLTDHEVDEILNHFDKDGSGDIDFDEFAYVMTGPHLDDKHGDTTGIPFAHQRSLDSMSPAAQKVLSPPSASASRSSSCKVKNKSKSSDHSSKKQTDEHPPMAGMYGRRIVNSAPAGRERIKFITTSPGPGPSKPAKGSKPKHITSAAELRVLGSSRPLTSKKVVGNAFVTPAPKPTQGSSLNADAVIERYHGLYEKPAAKEKQKQKAKKRVSDASLDSDNFSMCSDVIRHMNSPGEHVHLDDHYV